MSDIKESSLVDAVVSLQSATADDGQEFLLLTLHFESETSVRLPMPVAVAMRLWALLDEAKRQKGWPAPSMPVSTDQLQ